jgi:hypothetical protein
MIAEIKGCHCRHAPLFIYLILVTFFSWEDPIGVEQIIHALIAETMIAEIKGCHFRHAPLFIILSW